MKSEEQKIARIVSSTEAVTPAMAVAAARVDIAMEVLHTAKREHHDALGRLHTHVWVERKVMPYGLPPESVETLERLLKEVGEAQKRIITACEVVYAASCGLDEAVALGEGSVPNVVKGLPIKIRPVT